MTRLKFSYHLGVYKSYCVMVYPKLVIPSSDIFKLCTNEKKEFDLFYII